MSATLGENGRERLRRGFSLMEIAAAGILLAVMLTVCLEFFRATAAQHRGLQARRIALQEVANVMERLSARPWEDLTAKSVGQMPLSPEAEQALPEGALEIEIEPSQDDPDGKRISVVLRWPAGPGQPDRSVRLVVWRYRPQGE